MALIPMLVIAAMSGVAKATTTKVWVEPSNFGNVEPGTPLTFDIMISNVVGLSSYELLIEFDPFVVNPISITQGGFLSEDGTYLTYFVFSVSTFLDSVLIGETMLEDATISGSGKLATITAKAVGSGSTDISLSSTLLDNYLMPIGHTDFGSQVAVHEIAKVLGPYEEHNRYSISGDEDMLNTLYAPIENVGGVGDVNAYAIFIGYAQTGAMIKLKSATVLVLQGQTVTVSVGFNATKYGVGKYYFETRAYFQYLVGDFYRSASSKTLSFVVLP